MSRYWEDHAIGCEIRRAVDANASYNELAELARKLTAEPETERAGRSSEMFAETDPENWPSGRPTFGAGR